MYHPPPPRLLQCFYQPHLVMLVGRLCGTGARGPELMYYLLLAQNNLRWLIAYVLTFEPFPSSFRNW